MNTRDNSRAELDPQSPILHPAVRYPHPFIAKEGWPFIAAAFTAAGATHWLAGAGWAALPWLITAFMVQFFRDPPRAIP